jgi:hypothetical protein
MFETEIENALDELTLAAAPLAATAAAQPSELIFAVQYTLTSGA